MASVKKSNPKTSGQPDGDTTRKQELGSAWIFRRALNDNKRYKSPDDIEKDPKFPELKALYPEINKQWLASYYAQHKTMLEEFSGSRFTEFNRDGGFMDYISNLIKEKYGIAKKDTWDPADIWCIKDEGQVIGALDKKIKNSKATELGELNSLLRTFFKQRKVVGISLKLISGKEAKYEEVNVDGDEFVDKAHYNFNVSRMTCPLGLKPSTVRPKKGDKAYTFSTQDSRVYVDAIEKGQKVVYNFQIKANSTSGFNNLKWEPTSSLGAKARLGKSPIAMVLNLLKNYGINFSNNNGDYPHSLEDFMQAGYQKKAKAMYTAIKAAGVETGISSAKEFIDNMASVFKYEPHTANSKLMQMTFLYEICKLKKEERDDLMTDMVFVAQKKGPQFGPFGKIY